MSRILLPVLDSFGLFLFLSFFGGGSGRGVEMVFGSLYFDFFFLNSFLEGRIFFLFPCLFCFSHRGLVNIFGKELDYVVFGSHPPHLPPFAIASISPPPISEKLELEDSIHMTSNKRGRLLEARTHLLHFRLSSRYG